MQRMCSARTGRSLPGMQDRMRRTRVSSAHATRMSPLLGPTRRIRNDPTFEGEDVSTSLVL